jgi:catechol 2,3-dioxygenase-like lactoylglutathione lyase family enzyme
VLTGLAHSAICVPDVDAAVAWYESVLGLTVLSPPYLMEGPEIERDMGELIPNPRLKAAILGVPGDGDRVLELIEYPGSPGRPRAADASVVDLGLTHVGLVCDDIDETRAALEAHDVTFLTTAIAKIAGLRTTWFADPFGVVFILLEKRDQSLPYFAQYEGR